MSKHQHRKSRNKPVINEFFQPKMNCQRRESKHWKKKKYYQLHSCVKKFPYKTQEDAIYRALVINDKEDRRNEVSEYKCDFCDFWHVGRVVTFAKNQPRHESHRFLGDWEIELGNRASHCLWQENHNPKGKYLIKMLDSVARKYYNMSYDYRKIRP